MKTWFYKRIILSLLKWLESDMDADFSPEISHAIDGCNAVLEYLES